MESSYFEISDEWEKIWYEAQENEDTTALGKLLEEIYPGFKYDPNSITPLATQFYAYQQVYAQQQGDREPTKSWVNFETVAWGVCEIGAGIWAGGKAIAIAGASSQGLADPALVLVYSGTAIAQFSYGFTDILGGFQGDVTLGEQIQKDPYIPELLKYAPILPYPPVWKKETWPISDKIEK